MKQDELKEHILKTYFWSRVGIAAISILFPLVLWFVGLSLNVHLQGSISAYYHTPMRDVFVGSLFAIGAFLYLYRGYSTVENIALDFAGIFAIGVAILPTSAISEPKCDTFTAPYLHGVCAILFFIAIAYVCIFQSSETLKEMIDESRRKFYEILYKILGVGMIVLPLLSALLLHLLDKTQSIVFFVELAGVWIFSTYWIVKSLEIQESHLDNTLSVGLHPTFKAPLI